MLFNSYDRFKNSKLLLNSFSIRSSDQPGLGKGRFVSMILKLELAFWTISSRTLNLAPRLNKFHRLSP